MKRICLFIFIIAALSLLAGCANGGPIPAAADTSQGSAGSGYSLPANEPGEVDIDLTKLSSTMVFAQVNSMMEDPGRYLGQRVKMSGPYYASAAELAGQYYHYCIIEDATACCAQGLEFIYDGDTARENYPEDGAAIEVYGVFDQYEEDGLVYYYIAADTLELQ